MSESLRQTLAGQMRYQYFPVTLISSAPAISYHELVEGMFEIDDVMRAHAVPQPPRAHARVSLGV